MPTALGEAFVIWLDDDLKTGELRGTIERVALGSRARFEDERSLVRLLQTTGGWRAKSGVPIECHRQEDGRLRQEDDRHDEGHDADSPARHGRRT